MWLGTSPPPPRFPAPAPAPPPLHSTPCPYQHLICSHELCVGSGAGCVTLEAAHPPAHGWFKFVERAHLCSRCTSSPFLWRANPCGCANPQSTQHLKDFVSMLEGAWEGSQPGRVCAWGRGRGWGTADRSSSPGRDLGSAPPRHPNLEHSSAWAQLHYVLSAGATMVSSLR